MEMWKLLSARESLNEALITLEMLERGEVLTASATAAAKAAKDALKHVRSEVQLCIDVTTMKR